MQYMESANFLSFTVWCLVFGLNIIFGYINNPGKAAKISKKRLFVSNFNFDSFIKVVLKIATSFQNVLTFEKWQTTVN